MPIKNRFRGFFPVVIDVETGGLDPNKNALLEIAALTLKMDETGHFSPDQVWHKHIVPFEGSKLDQEALNFNKIKVDHPFRFAMEEKEAIHELFDFLKKPLADSKCERCVVVGHNAWFDLHFLLAAIKRAKIKKNIFHRFTSFDTATLAALIYGQTVLALAMKAANIKFDTKEAHSAVYDATKTAELFCTMVNKVNNLTL